MALRVLLADESSTIKKVFQLALQDFAVEVRPVNIGVDVLAVAQSFQPDIVFVDILLQKKNGYEVSAELKQNAQLKIIPIVLMWSGFMELDDDKFQASKANAQLEKPFDVSALRKLVTDLVPRTQNQRISQFLSFPDAKEEPTAPPAEVKNAEVPTPDAAAGLASEPEEDFTQVPIAKMKGDKFRVDIQPEELEPEHIPVAYEVPDEVDTAEHLTPTPTPPPPSPQFEDDDELVALDEDPVMPPPPTAPAAHAAALPALSEKELEKIIRAQSAQVIESVVWKVIPEIATQIIERELKKLLHERDQHPY